MKKLLLIAALLLAALLIGLGVLIATFDADRYRPLLVDRMQQALGKSVRLERLSLGWRGGLALRLDGLAVFDDAAARGEPALQVESASALVALGPLLRKDVQVASVTLLRPRIRVVRSAQGTVNLTPPVPAAAASQAQSPETPAPPQPAVSFAVHSLRVEDGALHWIDAAAHPPVELRLTKLDVTVTNIAPGRPMDIEVRGAIAGGQPDLRLTGRLTLPGPTSSGSLERMQFSLDGVSLEHVVPAAAPGEPQLRGRLTLNLQGTAPTLDPQALTRSLSASGRVQLAEPVIANLNLLREVFDKLSMLPGLTQRLRERLPPEYQAKFDATDTVLRPVDLSGTLENGALRFADVRLQTDTFGIAGGGQVGLDGSVQVQSVLRIDPAFSQALIRSVSELQYLTNREGEMELPVAVQGRLPRLALVPDLQYVASRVIVNKATQLLGEWLNKQAPEEPAPSGAPPAEGQPPAAESGEPDAGALLGQFLRRTLQQDPADQ